MLTSSSKKRLIEQGARLEQQTATLNTARLEEFGSTQMQVIARTRIRTEHNCVAQDMVQVGEYLLFGYNVFMGLKRASNVKDVLSLYRLIEPVESEEEYQLEEVDLTGTFFWVKMPLSKTSMSCTDIISKRA
ncbi:hypothetical protein JCM18901_2223 [Psychrobacter sp. JCM 18901]|nr:hypothetical protein JCM18901_2223 [Psychrobacter sp. JCM 18901]